VKVFGQRAESLGGVSGKGRGGRNHGRRQEKGSSRGKRVQEATRALGQGETRKSRLRRKATSESREEKEQRRRYRKQQQLYAERGLDIDTEEGAAARVRSCARERPHRATTVHTHRRVWQLRGFPTHIHQPFHTRHKYGRPLGPE
jgi:hypothetical protein